MLAGDIFPTSALVVPQAIGLANDTAEEVTSKFHELIAPVGNESSG